MPHIPLRVLLIVTSLALSIGAQVPDTQWAHITGSTTGQGDVGVAVATLPGGDFVAMGQFDGTVDFDPGPGSLTMTSPGRSASLCRYDRDGRIVWARQLESTGEANPQGLATGPFGYVYSVGTFTGSIDLDPGPGVVGASAPPLGGFGYISVLDGNGDLAAGGILTGTGLAVPRAIALDGAGNVFVSGIFSWTVDFDPGPGVFNLSAPWNSGAMFVLKLDSSGAFQWAFKVDTGAAGGVRNAAVDPATGDIVLVGKLNGTVDFDPSPASATVSSAGSSDAFIARYSNAGGLLWVGACGGPSIDSAEDVALAPNGDIHVTGSLWGTGDFDPGPGTYPLSSANGGYYLMTLTPPGALAWAGAVAPSMFARVQGLDVDGAGDLYLTSFVQGNADIDPGGGVTTVAAGSLGATLVSKLTSSGNLLWHGEYGVPTSASTTTNFHLADDIVAYHDGSALLIGKGGVAAGDYDPGPGTLPLSAIGSLGIVLYRTGLVTLEGQQGGPGAPVTVRHANLRPGAEYFTVFSTDLCGVVGAGPYAGLCASNPSTLTAQLAYPLGTPIFHFLAPGTDVTWPAFTTSPLTVDGVCGRFAGNAIEALSSVIRFSVQ